MGSLSIWHWLVILLLVVLIFGAARARNLGADLAGAIRSFRETSKAGGETSDSSSASRLASSSVSEMSAKKDSLST
jgi:sec-independent protein translocase protein TatA